MLNELDEMVANHEKKLAQHDKELARLNDVTLEMQKAMNEGLARVDESNRFLREQNTHQSEQLTRTFEAVLNRNERSSERDYELKMFNRKNMFKLIFGIAASSGAIAAFILELLKYFGR